MMFLEADEMQGIATSMLESRAAEAPCRLGRRDQGTGGVYKIRRGSPSEPDNAYADGSVARTAG